MAKFFDDQLKKYTLVGLITIGIIYFAGPAFKAALINGELNKFVGSSIQNIAYPSGSKSVPPSVTLDPQKQYTATVLTSVGNFTIDLFEKSAPKNTANFIGNAKGGIYSNASIIVRNDLFKVGVKTQPSNKVLDEINADYLLLGKTKVKEATFLKELYDPKDETTKGFSPENLSRYEDFSLKEFYTYGLNYTYSNTLETPTAKKYIVMMAHSGPDQNMADFFIVLANTMPQSDGLYTPIGQVNSGFDTVDKNIAGSTGNITVNSITINEDSL